MGPTAKGDRRMTRTRRRTSKRVLTRLTVAALLAATVNAAGAQQAGTGRIIGTITDRTAGAPIQNVSVTVTGSALGGRTGTDGKYTIADVPGGRATTPCRPASAMHRSTNRSRCRPDKSSR
jgi:hypothetical protein